MGRFLRHDWLQRVVLCSSRQATIGQKETLGSVNEIRGNSLIGDPSLAEAILNRLVHNAYWINLKRESMRKRTKKVTAPGASDL